MIKCLGMEEKPVIWRHGKSEVLERLCFTMCPAGIRKQVWFSKIGVYGEKNLNTNLIFQKKVIFLELYPFHFSSILFIDLLCFFHDIIFLKFLVILGDQLIFSQTLYLLHMLCITMEDESVYLRQFFHKIPRAFLL